MNKTYFKRPLSFILALLMVVGLVPFQVSSAGETLTGSATGSGTRVADASTLNSWQSLFGTATNFSTENAGHVWTDKSVLTSASELAYAKELSDNTSTIALSDKGNNFLVALSAIASSKSVTGEANKPTDTIFVLDLSSSMYRGSAKETATIKSMVEAVNNTIANLQNLNVHNRVGVVIYFGGPDLNQATAPSYQTWLSLDRYSHSSNKYLTYKTSSGALTSVGVNTKVTNSSGTTVTNTTRTVPNVSGTYVQQGLLAALELFSKADTTVPANAETQSGVKRTPVIVLMSDGKPTAATNDYTNIESDAVMGSNREDIRSDAETDFLTQLTAAYAKESVAAHYNETPLFYSLSLGNTISYDVMDPLNTLKLNSGTYTSKISGYWDSLISASSSISITAKVSKGQWNANTTNKTVTVKKTTLNGASFPSAKTQQNYVNKAFVASTASELATVFNDIFTNITLQTHTYSTLVSGSADLGGYVSFVDKIGEYMTVTDVKGILIGNTWYSGKELSKNFVTGGGSLGTTSAPTTLGDELVHAVQARLDIDSVTTARALLENAYMYGQLSYNSQYGTYSNYVGWYADAAGKFLGFWHEGSTTQPAGAVYYMKSYLYLGTADASHGVQDSDLMYATVQHRTNIATGEETMTFAIPAALLPSVTYDIDLDANGNPTQITMGGATNPVRLVYEVALDDNINEVTILESGVVDSAYLSANTDSDGVIHFYSNQYEKDNTTGYGKVNTYSYFRPSHSNENYYFQNDEIIYTDTSGTKYTGTTAPNANGTYYRRTTVYKVVNGVNSKETAYIKLSADALATAKANSDNTWYVSAGNVHADLDRYESAKYYNYTGTLPNVEDPFVDLYGHNVNDTGHTFVIGYTLGNNGRVSIVPATGIKITKSVTEANTDAAAPTSFDFTVTNKTNTSDSSTYTSYLVSANGVTEKSTITFANGKATFSIKDGETFYIAGMKAGDVINVSETETEYYMVSSVNSTPSVNNLDLTLENQKLSAAAFVNTARGKGNLTIAKNVEHELGSDYTIPADKKFNVSVTLSGIGVNGKTFTAQHSGDTTVTAITVDADGKFSFTIGHGEQFQVFGLPEGTVATVEETGIPEGFSVQYKEDNAAGDGIVNIAKDTTSAVEVLNTYKPEPVKAGVQIVAEIPKNFVYTDNTEVADWGDLTFSAVLQKYNGTEWVDLQTVTATNSNRKFTFDFSEEEYTKAGVYSYQIREVIPAEDERGTILYDRTYHTFSVVVGDSDMDGKLEILNVVSEHTGQEFTKNEGGAWVVPASFTNTQEEIVPAVVEIPIQKALTNLSESQLVSLSGYHFGLYTDAACTAAVTTDTDGVQKLELAHTDNVGEGFIDITLDKAGDYTFYIKEISGDVTAMKYSQQVVKVTITVTGPTSGRLSATATFDTETNADKELVFTNTYEPTPAKINIDVRKTLSGRPLADGEFSFTLKSADGSYSETVAGKADGDVPFTDLEFTKVGTYVYYVNEVIPADADKLGGITYDTTVHTVTVKVVDQGGVLEASYVVENTANNYVVFTNIYNTEPVEYTFEGKKVLEGRELLNDEFGFTLTPCDENGNPIVGGKVLEARNALDGSFKFDPIKFTAPGTYYYIAAEKQENTAGGVTYDTTEYLIQIVITDDLKGALKVDSVSTIVKLARRTATELVFTNVYVPASTSETLGGTKFYTTEINGTLESLDLSKTSFAFYLYASDANWTLGEHLKTANNKADGSFSFEALEFDTAGTYYYIVKEYNSGELIDGIRYDDTVYRVVIKVTDNGKGALTATTSIYDEKDVQQDGISFSNTYKITDNTEIVIEGSKILHGKTLEADKYEFELIETTGGKKDRIDTAKNDASGRFSFDPITYTQPGVYTYTVSEIKGNLGGITYDASVYNVTVTVTDDGTGKLIARASGTESIVFTNAYNPASAKVSVSGTKLLEGRKLVANEFTFVITDSLGNIIETVKNDADGNFKFKDLEFTKVGEYTYTVKEADGFTGGITYDTTVYTIVVNVTDNGEGQLIATVNLNGSAFTAAPQTEVSLGGLKFTNKYSTTDVSVSFKGNKTLVGRILKEGEFRFVLKDSAGNEIETVGVNADGTFSFSSITYTKDQIGEYTYTVSEVIPDDTNKIAGVTYDNTVYTIKVVVSDNGKGAIEATVTGADGISFRNTYNASPAEIHFGGIKHLEGRGLIAGEFSFILKGENVNETVSNDANGNFEFHSIKFEKAGEYVYTINEVIPAVANGVTYDQTVYTITVNVADSGNGQLTAAIIKVMAGNTEVANKAIVFNNTYKPAPTVPVIISGNKILDGNDISKFDGMFSFELKDANGNVVYTVTNDAQGNFSFPALNYESAGVYTYTVSEIKGIINGVKYDENAHVVVVTVTDNGIGQLIANVSGNIGIIFRNSYNATPDSITLSGRKNLEGKPLEAGEFSFTLTDTIENRVIETVTNNADGSFSFRTLNFTKAGVYTYRIEELIGSRNEISYDTNVYNITVTVTDDNGVLKCTAEITDSTGSSVNNIEFNNKYNLTPTSIQLSGTKVLEGRDLKNGEFSFVLTDVTDPSNKKVVETVTNGADGKFHFAAIEHKEAGTFKYTIHEVNNKLGGVTYDTTIYNITVIISDNGDGTLSKDVKATYVLNSTSTIERDTSVNSIKFKNKYKSTNATAEFFARKTLIGRDLKKGEFEFELKYVFGGVIAKVTNDENGLIKFPTLTYTTPGVHYYLVSEVNNNVDGITYDESTFMIYVSVVDNGNGQLQAFATVPEFISFTNYYSPKPTSVQFKATKRLQGRNLEDGEFSFELKDSYGNVIETVKNSADGSIVFSNIEYTEAGTYVYTISEVLGDLENVTYDTGVHTVSVKVVDNGNGALVATVYDAENIVFTNEYEEPEVTTEVPEETTEVPEETTEVPDETTEVPEETTVPDETTEVSEETTVPDETTEVPEITTGPDETTEVPEVTTELPEITTTPEETTEVPEVTTMPEETTSPEDTEQPWSPDTRDNANTIIWFGAIFVAFCTTAGVLFSKKRDNEIE